MAKKENTSAAAKVAKAEKQAAKGAEDSKLTSAQKVAKAEKSKAKAAKPKNPNGNIFQRFAKGFKKFYRCIFTDIICFIHDQNPPASPEMLPVSWKSVLLRHGSCHSHLHPGSTAGSLLPQSVSWRFWNLQGYACIPSD